MLRIIPYTGHGVAVEVGHYDARPFARIKAIAGSARLQRISARIQAVSRAGLLRELVHQSLVESGLLRSVIVILIAGHRLRVAQQERLRGVGVLAEQAPGQ